MHQWLMKNLSPLQSKGGVMNERPKSVTLANSLPDNVRRYGRQLAIAPIVGLPSKSVPTAVSSEAAMRKTDALVDVRWDLDAKNDEPLDYDANIWTLPSDENRFQIVYSAAQSTWAIEENQNCDQVRRQI